jgi:hypothetical protein
MDGHALIAVAFAQSRKLTPTAGVKTFATPWLRAEGLAALTLATLAYGHFHLPWLWFGVLLLAPDLSMFAYLGGSRAGAFAYNLAHTYVFALVPVATGLLTGQRVALGVGLIWCAHIGLDRALGYGLKLPEGFGQTHLGPVGKAKAGRA